MNLRLVILLTTIAVVCPATVGAELPRDKNFWPILVQRPADEDGVRKWTSLGPFLYGSNNDLGDELIGFRPVYHSLDTADGSKSRSFIYPLWYREYDAATDDNRWTILNLINSRSTEDEEDRFSVWPLYFSRDTGEPETSYKAFFPIYGDITQRFGQYRLQWAPFPFYVRYESGGAVTTSTPWPFIKNISGENHRGFEFWPLAGHREEVGVSSRQYLLWPLIYDRHTGLDTDTPSRRSGVLPFYAAEDGPGYHSRTYGWPFFGYSKRTSPTNYRQTNLFWPLWVQGRGDTRYVNRWAPFYTHSVSPARKQTWFMWPLWRDRQWSSQHLDHRRQQVLYFVYHAEVQTSRQSPDLPAAVKRHVWPLFSQWNDGAGRAQFQAFSPLEVFFPHNERMRQHWSPLFAVYRFNQKAPGEARHSWLWDAVTFERSDERQTREFHFGPIFNYTAGPDGRRWGFLGGLLDFDLPANGSLAAKSALLSTQP